MASKADAAKAAFKKDFKSGKMKVNTGEVISPAKIVAKIADKVVSKVVWKVIDKKVVKANKAVAKKLAANTAKAVTTRGVKSTKAVKTAAETQKIASNSVKVKDGFKFASNAERNQLEKLRVMKAKDGVTARFGAQLVRTGKPKTTIKIK
jgi:hypothetical protein